MLNSQYRKIQSVLLTIVLFSFAADTDSHVNAEKRFWIHANAGLFSYLMKQA